MLWLVVDDEKVIVATVVLKGFRGIAWELKVALAKVPITDDIFGDCQSPVVTDSVALVTL
jgi:hypothetical protein